MKNRQLKLPGVADEVPAAIITGRLAPCRYNVDEVPAAIIITGRLAPCR